VQSPTDPCLYTLGSRTKKNQGGATKRSPFVYLLAYVIDCIMSCNSPEAINTIVARIKDDFEGRLDDMGELHNFLGTEVNRNREKRVLKINIDIIATS
jgi:uncharacterized protein YeeX (DUF496 family)